MAPPAQRPRLSRLSSFVKQKLAAGFLALFPIAVTVWIVKKVLGFLDGIIGRNLAHPIPGLGLLTLFVLLLLVGSLVTSYLGKKLFDLYDRLLSRVPFARTVYTSVKKFIEALSPEGRKGSFQKVVLIEYPRLGVWSVAFVTKECEPPMQRAVVAGDTLFYVYLPHTPNPTSGVLLLVPRSQIVPLPMTVEEGVKLLLSGGLIPPEYVPAAPAALPGEVPASTPAAVGSSASAG